MEFEEFVQQFRERTAQRMVEFEKALAKAQAEMEKNNTAAPGQRQRHQKPVAPHPPLPTQRKTPGWGRRTVGPIQGVLKKL